MKHRRILSFRQALRDATLGILLFLALGPLVATGAETWSITSAAASGGNGLPDGLADAIALMPAQSASSASLLGHAPPHVAQILVLATTFAVLFAFNAAVLRHLRRVYASPRRDGWRRGR